MEDILLISVADYEPATSPDVLHRVGKEGREVNHPLKFMVLFPCCHHLFGVCQGILSVCKECVRGMLIRSC